MLTEFVRITFEAIQGCNLYLFLLLWTIDEVSYKSKQVNENQNVCSKRAKCAKTCLECTSASVVYSYYVTKYVLIYDQSF